MTPRRRSEPLSGAEGLLGVSKGFTRRWNQAESRVTGRDRSHSSLVQTQLRGPGKQIQAS